MKKEEIEEVIELVWRRSFPYANQFGAPQMRKETFAERVKEIIAEIQKRQKPFRLPFARVMHNEHQEEMCCLTPGQWKHIVTARPLFTFPPAEQKGKCKVPEGYALLNVDELRGLTYSFDGRDKLETMLAAAPKPPEYSE